MAQGESMLQRIQLLSVDDPRLVQGLKRLFRNYLVVAALGIAVGQAFHSSNHNPGIALQDFVAFWSASKLALDGKPQDVYDPAQLSVASRQVLPGSSARIHWYYPPPALLIYEPWALLPYLVGWATFVCLTTGLLVWVVKKIVDTPLALWATLAAPAVALNGWSGQNGALSAALIGMSLLYLREAPVRAGLSMAMLAYKPHLLLLLAVTLVIDRRWTACAVAIAAIVGAAGLATWLYGLGIWEAWWHFTPKTDGDLQSERIPYDRMACVYGAARALGLGVTTSAALHLTVAVPTVVMVVMLWCRTNVAFDVKAAALAFGTLLVPPYLYYYDYVLTIVGLAFWIRHAMRTGWQGKEYLMMVVVWGLPLLLVICISMPMIPLAPLIMMAVIVFLLRRVEGHTP